MEEKVRVMWRKVFGVQEEGVSWGKDCGVEGRRAVAWRAGGLWRGGKAWP